MRALRRSTPWVLVLLGGLSLTFVGCPPTVDDSLSPPIIHGPLYRCAEMVAFSGADRDANLIVYVNGTQVLERQLWMGWGAVRLPSPLVSGDVVTAAQVVGSGISHQTREPVTAVTIPTDVAPGQRLPDPEVVPPLYECQKVVRVDQVVHGATVTLRDSDGNTYEGMTPYTRIRLGTPELTAGKEWEAMQKMCIDAPYTSGWSAKETVQPKPASLEAPTLSEPLVVGNDACQVHGLVPGALVEIHADDGSGPVKVGGGIAVESATIFRIDPPFQSGSTYHATQALCDLTSPGGTPGTPVADPPAPRIDPPVCDGEMYVTVCDTAVMSTVRVFLDGTQVARAAGNGGCLRLALGDATTCNTGQQVTADQTVAGNTGPASPAVTVTADAAPPYHPAFWNADPFVQQHNNCYNYGCNRRTDTFAQPGEAHGVFPVMQCASVANAAQADGLVTAVEQSCTGCVHKVALVVDPGTDYHWYRLDDTGRWSHKPGPTPATDLDASGNPISDPAAADRTYVGSTYTLDYTDFCGYFCVDRDVVDIR